MFDILQLGGNLMAFLSNNLEDAVGTALIWIFEWLVSMLPDAPFAALTLGGAGLPEDSISWLNWFADIGGMADLMAGWLLCVMVYMVVSKLIQVLQSMPEATWLLGDGFIQTVTDLLGGGE